MRRRAAVLQCACVMPPARAPHRPAGVRHARTRQGNPGCGCGGCGGPHRVPLYAARVAVRLMFGAARVLASACVLSVRAGVCAGVCAGLCARAAETAAEAALVPLRGRRARAL
jgi:hypothetical protein